LTKLRGGYRKGEIEEQVLLTKIDECLQVLNDDYKVERMHALREVRISIISPSLFYGWLKAQGKEGGQNKFPRVLKGDKIQNWLEFLRSNGKEV